MVDEKSLKEIQEIIFNTDFQDQIHNEHTELIARLKKAISEKVESLTDSIPEKIVDLINHINNTEITVELTLRDCATLLVKMEKFLKLERERIGSEKIIKFFIDRDRKSFEAYNEPGRQDKKLRNVAKIYGLTNGSGNRQSKIDGSAIFWDYLELVFGTYNPETLKKKKPIGKWEAIGIIKEKHEIQSNEAVLKHLKKEIAKRKKKAKDSGYTGGFDGLLPSNWPKV